MSEMNEAQADRRVARREVVVFRVCEDEYCIAIGSVREIRRWSEATRLPRTPHFVKGVINLRGVVLPVIDFAARIGLGDTATTSRHSTIVVEVRGHLLGLLVETVTDILSIPETDFQPTPALAGDETNEMVSGVILLNDRLLRIVDVERFAPHVESEPA